MPLAHQNFRALGGMGLLLTFLSFMVLSVVAYAGTRDSDRSRSQGLRYIERDEHVRRPTLEIRRQDVPTSDATIVEDLRTTNTPSRSKPRPATLDSAEISTSSSTAPLSFSKTTITVVTSIPIYPTHASTATGNTTTAQIYTNDSSIISSTFVSKGSSTSKYYTNSTTLTPTLEPSTPSESPSSTVLTTKSTAIVTSFGNTTTTLFTASTPSWSRRPAGNATVTGDTTFSAPTTSSTLTSTTALTYSTTNTRPVTNSTLMDYSTNTGSVSNSAMTSTRKSNTTNSPDRPLTTIISTYSPTTTIVTLRSSSTFTNMTTCNEEETTVTPRPSPPRSSSNTISNSVSNSSFILLSTSKSQASNRTIESSPTTGTNTDSNSTSKSTASTSVSTDTVFTTSDGQTVTIISISSTVVTFPAEPTASPSTNATLGPFNTTIQSSSSVPVTNSTRIIVSSTSPTIVPSTSSLSTSIPTMVSTPRSSSRVSTNSSTRAATDTSTSSILSSSVKTVPTTSVIETSLTSVITMVSSSTSTSSAVSTTTYESLDWYYKNADSWQNVEPEQRNQIHKEIEDMRKDDLTAAPDNRGDCRDLPDDPCIDVKKVVEKEKKKDDEDDDDDDDHLGLILFGSIGGPAISASVWWLFRHRNTVIDWTRKLWQRHPTLFEEIKAKIPKPRLSKLGFLDCCKPPPIPMPPIPPPPPIVQPPPPGPPAGGEPELGDGEPEPDGTHRSIPPKISRRREPFMRMLTTAKNPECPPELEKIKAELKAEQKKTRKLNRELLKAQKDNEALDTSLDNCVEGVNSGSNSNALQAKLLKDLAKSEAELKKSQLEVVRLSLQLKEALSKAKALEELNEPGGEGDGDIRQRLLKAIEKQAELQSSVNQLEREARKGNKPLQKCRDQNLRLRKRVEDAKKVLEKEQAEKIKLGEERDQYKTALVKMQTTLQKAKSDLEKAKAKCKLKDGGTGESLTRCQAELTKAKGLVTELASTIKQLEKSVENKQELEQKVKKCQSRVGELYDISKQLQRAKETAEAELAACKEVSKPHGPNDPPPQCAEKLAELEKAVKKSRSNNQKLQKVQKQLEEEAETDKKSLAELANKIEKLTTDLTKCKSQLKPGKKPPGPPEMCPPQEPCNGPDARACGALRSSASSFVESYDKIQEKVGDWIKDVAADQDSWIQTCELPTGAGPDYGPLSAPPVWPTVPDPLRQSPGHSKRDMMNSSSIPLVRFINGTLGRIRRPFLPLRWDA